MNVIGLYRSIMYFDSGKRDTLRRLLFEVRDIGYAANLAGFNLSDLKCCAILYNDYYLR